MRRLLPFLVLFLPALPAEAQTVGDVVDQLVFRGYYVESGVDVDIDAMERLVADHPDVGFVALGASPSGGPDLFADDVLNRVERLTTVLVLTADQVGGASAVYSSDQLSRAFDEAITGSGDSYEVDFVQLANALTTSADSGKPASGGWLLPVLLVGGVAVVGFVIWRNRRRDEETVDRRLEQARGEIRAQMSVIANQILEFSDRADLDAHPEAREHYRRAAAVYEAAEGRLSGATSESQLEELADDLDEARWELAAAEALVAGKPVPPRPEEERPEPCFFDPTHGAGVEEATITTPAGTRKVMVCAADADTLRRGERPEPRSIDVGGRRVPAPTAPRSYGGRGFDWLDVFSILVGGMGDAARYRWPRGGSRVGTGRLGIPLPRRPSGTSRSRTTGRTSSSRSSSRTVGRARRRR